MSKKKDQKVKHRKKGHKKSHKIKKKTAMRLNKGSRGMMHHRMLRPKNNKTPWIFKFPKTKKSIRKLMGYKDTSIKDIPNPRAAEPEDEFNSVQSNESIQSNDSFHTVRSDESLDRNISSPAVSPPESPKRLPGLIKPNPNSPKPSDMMKGKLSGPLKGKLSGPTRDPSPMRLGSPIPDLPNFYDKIYIGKVRVLTVDLIVTVKLRKNTNGSENGLMDLYLIADVSGWSNILIRKGINSVKDDLIKVLNDFNSKNKDIDLKHNFGDKYIKICLKNIKFNHEIDDKGFVIVPDSTLDNLFSDIRDSMGSEQMPMLKIHVRKDNWKQIKPKNLGTSNRSCKSTNCLQVFFYVSTNLSILKNVDKTLVLEESKRHSINDDICSDFEMSKSPKEYMRGSKSKKYKKTKKKKKKKNKKH